MGDAPERPGFQGTSYHGAFWKEGLGKEESARRKYWPGRWPEGGYAAQQDAYDADHVAPIHDLHRAFVTPVSLMLRKGDKTPIQTPAQQATLGRSASTPASPVLSKPGVSVEDIVAGAPTSPMALSEPPCAADLAGRATTAASSRLGADLRAATSGTGRSRSATALTKSARVATSLRSGGSRVSAASLRSHISEAVKREVERTALQDYRTYLQEKEDRARAKRLAMPVHLRTGPSPVYMGFPPRFLAESLDASSLPVKMAVDPKWSTELKKMNDKVGMRIEYERRLSATVPGSIAPELPHMYPKRHLSNPPTPYFKPGAKPGV